MMVILKYMSWLLAVGVGFAGSWMFEFTATDPVSRRKRLTQSGKWAAGLSILGLASALSWTVLEDLQRQDEKEQLVKFQRESERREIELQASQAAAQKLREEINDKQDDLSRSMDVVTFLLKEDREDLTEDERSRYRASFQAITNLLSEQQNERLRELSQFRPEAIGRAVAQSSRETVDLVVSNSLECLDALQRTDSDDPSRRMVARLSESTGLGVVVSVFGDSSLNFRLMQPREDLDLSAGFELEFDDHVRKRVGRERCQPRSGCDVTVELAAPEGWHEDLVVQLAVAKIRSVRSLAEPEAVVLVEPGGAADVQRAFGCILDR